MSADIILHCDHSEVFALHPDLQRWCQNSFTGRDGEIAEQVRQDAARYGWSTVTITESDISGTAANTITHDYCKGHSR